MGRVCYLNGNFIPESELKISAYDFSVAQGVAAFEMTRSFNQAHFKLREHLERLEQSCTLLSIPMSFDGDLLEDICMATSALNTHGPGEEHRLLIVVSPGCAPMYRDLEGVIPHPFVYVADFPLSLTTHGMGRYFRDGVELSWSNVRQIPSSCIPSQAKHRGRTAFHLAQVQAPASTWPLMLDVSGQYVTECPGANLITVRGSRIYCANYEALPGISQQTVAEIMAALGYLVIWGPLTKAELLASEEVWISGTPFCALAASRLDGTIFGRTVYDKMLAAWSERVGVDLAAQIQEWDAARPHTIER